jgi:hypothetical protein
VFAVSVAALVTLAIYLIIFIRRGRRELNRLNAMREAYRQERNSSVP